MKKVFVSISLAALMFSCSGSEDGGNNTAPPAPVAETGNVVGNAGVWVTTGDSSKLLSKDASGASIYDDNATTDPSISVDFAQQYQEIEGFGAALTGSSANVINALPAAQKQALLKDLFSPAEGIGLSYLRLTIGASDFSLNDFTYNDLPEGSTDANLENFSIAADEVDVIPVLQSILTYAPNIKIMGSPWSAPAWMKTSGTLGGGSLKPEWYDTYGNYFVKYINAYAAKGISIDAVTPQNEPLHETTGYPTMKMTSGEQAEFIKSSLGPKFQAAGLNTKIIAYDHNFDVPSYPTDIYADAAASQYVDGAAFHAYAGNVGAMGQVHASYPNKNLYFTEVSGGQWSPDFAENLKWNTENIFIGTTKNWSKNVLLWNLALNTNHGPTNGGCADCRGVVTINSSGAITKNVEYYTLAHFSKFVRPGAKRVSSTEFDNSLSLKNVAFVNTDGSKVLVVLNTSSVSRKFAVKVGGNKIVYTLNPTAVATFVWQ
ncbi:glycoside hydrolase family 30 beta sandwich domain-containing protein [Flavobacterium sp. DG1-102-2]|uniref:glycoside hydrolase family 30 protein n=1 Tax=Flavobacterium sp. DG1-102-2 TaxID=3081663 RepID=UPI002948F3D5|nr:glycoside hydrolase family 30 beta sandwich domain-containing protein [Flavobacterium sp. DG1-102-2]MDV6169657.1 glycoside hydrolase family 30 beta sandwich domain-containing protein [Flavobacterium sp. DG1-102-2]